MAASIDSRMIMRPELCDVVLNDWAQDTLPDDGAALDLHCMANLTSGWFSPSGTGALPAFIAKECHNFRLSPFWLNFSTVFCTKGILALVY
jgi:hypothetical protein